MARPANPEQSRRMRDEATGRPGDSRRRTGGRRGGTGRAGGSDTELARESARRAYARARWTSVPPRRSARVDSITAAPYSCRARGRSLPPRSPVPGSGFGRRPTANPDSSESGAISGWSPETYAWVSNRRRRRVYPATPRSPAPRRSREPGSGTAVFTMSVLITELDDPAVSLFVENDTPK